MRVTIDIEPDELFLVEAALCLATRRKMRVAIPEPYLTPRNCKDFVYGYLRAGPKTKSQIKDFLESIGYERTGAGPTCTELLKEGRIQRPKRALYSL
jgi:hypothetical protein